MGFQIIRYSAKGEDVINLKKGQTWKKNPSNVSNKFGLD